MDRSCGAKMILRLESKKPCRHASEKPRSGWKVAGHIGKINSGKINSGMTAGHIGNIDSGEIDRGAKRGQCAGKRNGVVGSGRCAHDNSCYNL